MKFCFVTNWYPPDNFAGSGVYIYHLTHALAHRGHEVMVVYCRDSYALRSRGRRQANMPSAPGIRVRRLKNPFGAAAPFVVHQTGHPLLNHFTLKRLFKEDFDVINYHNISLIGGPKIYQYGHGIKLATLHDYWLICPLSTLFKRGEEICRKKECIRCTLSVRKPPQLWRYTSLLRKNLGHLDALVSPSRFLKELHEREGIKAPIFQLPYLVKPTDLEEKDEQRPPIPEPYFLFVGRLDVNKGVQEIIPAFKGGKHGHLVVAGDGFYRNKLEQLTGNSPFIHFLGYLNQAELMTCYKSALAIVVPSIWYDNYPMVILDAMRLKVPIVANDIAGPGELVRESGAGLCYRSKYGLETSLRRIRREPELRSFFGSRGKTFYEENFTEEVHLKRFFSIIETVSSSRNQAFFH